ncbi:alpha/beta fold hydrolase [Ekhidna sp.]|uniref:alpha/beta fold hydrolase n=1 Tax=Ekhidna sp. TaxID=2608089 RepID=UPI003CCB76D4
MKKIAFILILGFACQFRITDEKAKKSVDAVEIQFNDLLVGDRNMHYAYIDRGKSTLIVLIHGSPGSWNAFINFFEKDSLIMDFDILAVDRPGFGNSDFGEPEPSIEKQAFLVNEVLKEFPSKNKILVGHSLGGPVAARMGMDFPDDYTGMILVAPSIDPKLEEDEWYRDAIDTKVGAFFTPKEFEVSNSEILTLRNELTTMLPLWSKIKIETIVIQGTADSLVPKENADFAKQTLPDSLIEIVLLEDVNHFIPWTHPEEIIKAIRRLADNQ